MASAYLIKGRFKLLNRIGQGSFGIVWLCKDNTDGSTKVAKDMRLGIYNPGLEKVFFNEVRVLQMLTWSDHAEYFPTYYDHEDWNSLKKGRRGIIVMEQLGAPVGKVRMINPSKTFSPHNTAKIAMCVAKGLKYLHQWDFIHNDLHEYNIAFSLALDGKVLCKIIDYGSAQATKTKGGFLITNRPVNNCRTAAHVSLALNWMLPADERDDWESFFYFFLSMINKFHMKGNNKQLVDEKLKLYYDPESYLKNKHVLKLWNSIASQEYNTTFNPDLVIDVLQSFNVDFNEALDYQILGNILKVD